MKFWEIYLFTCWRVWSFFTSAKHHVNKVIQSQRVILIGDSLIRRPYLEYDLSGKIDSQILRKHEFIYINEGVNSNKIRDIRKRLPHIISSYNITEKDYVIVYWDSDCSDIDESQMSPEDVLELRSNYTLDVQSVIMDLKKRTPYLAMAGPGVLGEGPVGYSIRPCSRFANKNQMLDDYRKINQDVCQAKNITYIDIRQALQSARPSWWVLCSNFATVDGEHPNNRGSSIEATLFVNQINIWYHR